MSGLNDLITTCQCCTGITRLTPADLFNRPGLPELAYRVGTHARFKSSMLAAISPTDALSALTTRRQDDFSIALMDAWSMVLDVLTFYQERNANEAFLRTATLRESVLMLARLLGYELNPGVAASVLLAFELDTATAEGSPLEVILSSRTRAQSIPVKEETPQTFETDTEFVARPGWNVLKPRLTYSHPLTDEMRQFFVVGLSANLAAGDPMLLVTGEADDTQTHTFLRVVSIRPDAANGWTEVNLGVQPDPPPSGYIAPLKPIGILTMDYDSEKTLNGLTEDVAGGQVSTQVLGPLVEMGGFTLGELTDALFGLRVNLGEPPTPGGPGLYALRVTSAPFGHNAPAYKTTPIEWRTNSDDIFTGKDWDQVGGWPITSSAADGDLTPQGTIRLEQYFPEIMSDSWAVLEGAPGDKVYLVQSASQESVADFGLSGKATRISLGEAPGGPGTLEVDDYLLRNTAIHTASELLPLAPLPIDELEAGSETLELEEIVPDLLPGHTIIISGERTGDYEGVPGAEAVGLADVVQGAYTLLIFDRPLTFGYKRDTVKLYANVVAASHGETVEKEVLGSGDAAAAHQTFTLKKPPLTYVSAPVPSGGESTLEIRVNDILWHENDNPLLLGPEERAYGLRLDNEGHTYVDFGDGIRGARLPSGAENVSARYRSGIGLPGLVDAGRITLLPVKPLGVRGVTNPLASGGAQDPEQLDDARQNAPLTVLTLDRIVSLQDFEDFARAFSGIGKAQAAWVWSHGRRIVHITVAGPGGNEVPAETLVDLTAAMNDARVPHQPSEVAPFDKLFFTLTAKIKRHPDYDRDTLFAQVEQALRDTFAFEVRAFGQRVAESEIQACIQAVDGVEAVDLDSLTYVTTGLDNHPDDFGLPAFQARYDSVEEEILPAQLLLMTATPLALEEMR